MTEKQEENKFDASTLEVPWKIETAQTKVSHVSMEPDVQSEKVFPEQEPLVVYSTLGGVGWVVAACEGGFIIVLLLVLLGVI